MLEQFGGTAMDWVHRGIAKMVVRIQKKTQRMQLHKNPPLLKTPFCTAAGLFMVFLFFHCFSKISHGMLWLFIHGYSNQNQPNMVGTCGHQVALIFKNLVANDLEYSWMLYLPEISQNGPVMAGRRLGYGPKNQSQNQNFPNISKQITSNELGWISPWDPKNFLHKIKYVRLQKTNRFIPWKKYPKSKLQKHKSKIWNLRCKISQINFIIFHSCIYVPSCPPL